ncbi:BnaC04g11820D [Brassica napus]|uniref:BnaC04g11820D protein n=1 Tax=Brassica napus TaxID=3708 RepID=A0A078FGQ8_BRANA|nr:BnaC04g11820D [Brassica napus]
MAAAREFIILINKMRIYA